ncbi:MAG: hypothetical protein Ct9H300mP15_28790 [Gemmatimonadota bacterium]|nr:MAG: hypothetical protein Ct9H300mP15_28790 [Gemmatimonadota bacterium]
MCSGMFGCTTATRPVSRSWSVSARQKPQPKVAYNKRDQQAFPPPPSSGTQIEYSEARSPLTSASHSVIPERRQFRQTTPQGNQLKKSQVPARKCQRTRPVARNHFARSRKSEGYPERKLECVENDGGPTKQMLSYKQYHRAKEARIASGVNQISAIRIQ